MGISRVARISGFRGEDFGLLQGGFREFMGIRALAGICGRKISAVDGDFGLLWRFRAFMGMISGLPGRRSGFRGEHFGR